MLRHLAAELNRYYFTVWGWIEIGLGVLLVLLAVRGLKPAKFTIGFSVMLALSAIMIFYLAPRMVVIGRALDFVPRDPKPPSLAEFGFLHASYSILDSIKLLVGIWMAVALARSER